MGDPKGGNGIRRIQVLIALGTYSHTDPNAGGSVW